MNYLLKYILIPVLPFAIALAQIPQNPDSIAISPENSAPLDPVRSDSDSTSSLADTVSEGETKKTADIDTLINYTADSIYFNLNNRFTVLNKNAKVVYRGMELAAGRIIVDWDNNILTASPIPDTVFKSAIEYIYDSVKVTQHNSLTDTFYDTTLFLPVDSSIVVVIDSIKIVGYPVFKQDGDAVFGDTMIYNLKTKKGFVIQGKTDYGDGFYEGQGIKKVGDKIMNVGEGDFTTCSEDCPHYHFHSRKMKLIVKDKVIARPVVLYFSKVPVAIIPYGIFPSKSGRQSGIIFPTYSETASSGRSLRNLGYYYAESSYWDYKTTLDYFERYGFLFDGDLRYKKLYRIDGNLRGSYTHMNYDNQKKRRYDVNFQHNQTITPNASLLINAAYVSDGSYYQDLSSNPQDRMQRIIRSNATYRQKFKSANGNLEINLNNEKKLDDNTSVSTLPRISFRLGQRNIFPAEEDKKELSWYNKFAYSANFNLTNKQDRNRTTQYITLIDSTGNDTTLTEYDYNWMKQGAVNNTYSMVSPQTVMEYFVFNPSLNIKQDFTDFRQNYYLNPADNTILSKKEEGMFARHTFSLNAGLSTKIYGTFPVKFSSVQGFRHVVDPSVSFSYQPDFSKNGWGYYQYIEDTTGTVQKKDRYYGQSLIGNTPSSRSESFNFSLNNLFQMKRSKLVDGEEQVQKIDLFSLSMNTGYNTAASQFRWSNLNTSFRSTPVKGENLGYLNSLMVDFSTTHDFYAYNESGVRIDKFYFEYGNNFKKGKIIRLTSFSADATFRFSPPKTKKSKSEPNTAVDSTASSIEFTADEDSLQSEDSPLYVPPIQTVDRFGRNLDFKPPSIPWDLNTTLRYSWSRYSPLSDPNKTLWLENSFNINLTENWAIGYTNRVDMVTRELVSSGLTFYRDMHCWEGRFIWNPVGVGQGFFLKINVKSQGLRDLKLEKRKNESMGGFLAY